MGLLKARAGLAAAGRPWLAAANTFRFLRRARLGLWSAAHPTTGAAPATPFAWLVTRAWPEAAVWPRLEAADNLDRLFGWRRRRRRRRWVIRLDLDIFDHLAQLAKQLLLKTLGIEGAGDGDVEFAHLLRHFFDALRVLRLEKESSGKEGYGLASSYKRAV
ncbi:hypothetical protein MUK42_03208 [Musa troglodytarum]|uniref:Uncharacterized protein n=1 Tax=Musa troglodytarum TaxID=320322 RepID=A0A9E7HVZ2_9LILI|nr:hypothetical protein MUK42_03208 [Musa troglodytarum]